MKQQQTIALMFLETAKLMKSQVDYLCEIDSKFGDGDHGVTIGKIATVFETHVNDWKVEHTPIKKFLEDIGSAITNVSGGSAGPLYGTFFTGMAEAWQDETVLDARLFQKMMQGGLSELQYITTAKVGDKTMMDTLIPAVDAINACQGDLACMAKVGYESALEGAKASEGFVSKFGRARHYKEATIGTPDAGAISCTYIFQGFYQAIISN
ncbi:MAG: dihydroxyacetone kinase subunit L [Erysipelotrichaceae bacterium]